MEAALAMALDYLDRGWCPTPVVHKSKTPILKDWPQRHLTRDEVVAQFDAGAHNVGVVLGGASGDLVDIDLDSDEAVRLAPYFLPPTACKFGRESKPDSHWLYTVANAGRTERLLDPDTSASIIEYRGNGGCTVFPGSVHPSGEGIEFSESGVPSNASRDDLTTRIKQLAAASLLARHWMRGSRHNLALALSGALLKAGLDPGEVAHLIRSICEVVKDDDALDRVHCVETTFARLRDQEEVAGWSAMPACIGASARSQIARWLIPDDALETIASAEVSVETAMANLPFSDTSNAHWFVRNCSDARYLSTGREWLVWDGRQWARDESEHVLRLAREAVLKLGLHLSERKGVNQQAQDWVRQSLDYYRLRNMLAMSRGELSVTQEQLDRKLMLLNCQNGALDLRTGQLRQHDRGDLITMTIPVEYRAEAQCPTWLSFLDQVMFGDAEMVAFLKRAVGYSLTGVNSEECFFVLYGSGANGKSTFLTLVRALLGPLAMNAQAETLMIQKGARVRSDIARLAGARFVAVSEAEAQQEFASAQIKQLTGRDAVTARFLYGREFEFEPQFKIWLATNHLPKIHDTGEGMWRRVKLVPFEVTIPEGERDLKLGEKLRAELPGILAWAVDGCREWQEGGLRAPERVAGATRSYRGAMDLVGQFLADCSVRDAEGRTSTKDLYQAFETWCHENGDDPISKVGFGESLRDKGYEPWRAKTVRGWQGIRLLTAEEQVAAALAV